MEIEPTALTPLGEQLGERGHDPSAGRRERVPGGQRRAVDVELVAADRPERAVEPELVLAELRRLPRRQRREDLRRERLVDLVVVEVLQRQSVAGEQPRHGVRRRHQQPLVAVDEVDRGGLGVDEMGEHRQAALGGPLVGGEEHSGRSVGQRRRVARGHRVAVHRLECGQLFHRGVGPQVLVAGQPEIGREEIVEEAAVVGRRELVVRRQRERVLRLPLDAPALRGDRGVLAHGQPGAWLGVARHIGPERLVGTDLRQRPEPVGDGPRRVELEQGAAEVLVELERGVGGRVNAAGDARLDLPESDLVGDEDRRLQAGAARLLDVVRRGVRVEARAEHGLAGQVEVAGVLEHRAGDDVAEPHAGQTEPRDQPVQGRGEHVLVGCLRVAAVGPREGDPIAADDRGPSSRHARLPMLLMSRLRP